MRDRQPIIPMLIGLAGVVGLILLFVLGDDDKGAARVQHSVIGTAALGPWLRAADIAVTQSNPRLTPKLDDMGMRIMPLYDMDLYSDADTADTREKAFNASSLVDVEGWIYHAKVDELPSLVILPKWRGGITAVEVAHESLLIPLPEYDLLFEHIGLANARLTRGGPVMLAGDVGTEGQVQLFHAQLFDITSLPENCQPDLALPEGALTVLCQTQNEDFANTQSDKNRKDVVFLSDPDLMNNHGLANGANGAIARRIVTDRNPSPQKPVYIDISTEMLLVSDSETVDEGQYYQRETSDLARLFSPPFSVLWAVLLVVMTVLGWRGAVTILPRRPSSAPTGADLPRLAALAAKARLMRLGRHDGRIVAAFVQSEITRLSLASLGRTAGPAGPTLAAGNDPNLARLHALWSRRDPARADRLVADATALIHNTTALSPADLTRLLTSFRDNLEIMSHENADLGRVSTSRRSPAP